MPLDQVLLNIRNPFTPADGQRRQLDLARKLNALHSEKLHKEEQLEARIESFEMAFRMQTEATDAFDISKEPQDVRELYGNSENGAKLLVARRLVERGVRFVQVFAGGWDHHNNLEHEPPQEGRARSTSPPRRCSRTSSSAGCSTTRWSSGAASSAAPSPATAAAAASPAATTTAAGSAPGWPAAA